MLTVAASTSSTTRSVATWVRWRCRALGEDGQYIVIGFVAGIPKLAANQVLLRNRRVTGVDWGAWVGRHQDENRTLLAEVVERIAAGDLDPVEPVSYPLHDAARALRTWPTARWRARSHWFRAPECRLRTVGGDRDPDLADCSPTWWS